VYGAALPVLLLIVGVVFQILYSSKPTPLDNFERLKTLGIQRRVEDLLNGEPDTIRRQSEYRAEVDLFPALNYEPFQLLNETHVWDLRGWEPVPSVDILKPVSSTTLTSVFNLIKIDEAATYPIIAMTSGLDIFSRVDSRAFRVLTTESDERVSIGGTSLKKRLLEVDVSPEPLGEFSIETTRTYWNGFQHDDNTWVGTTVRQDVEDTISILVILPEDKRFFDYELLVAEVDSDRAYPYMGEQFVIEDDINHRYIFWEIVKPERNHVYRVDWHW
jgi:hypothetical protein